MSDPLSLVRQATITGTPVSYSDGNYIFGEFKFHESTKTFFKRSLKSRTFTIILSTPTIFNAAYFISSATDVFYSLKDIIFFLENAEMSVADYRRKAVENRITAVVEHDRHALKDYLTGVVETCPQIDLTAAAEFARSSATALSNSSITEKAHPQITLENMKQQREKHAAMLEKTVSKSKGLSSRYEPLALSRLVVHSVFV